MKIYKKKPQRMRLFVLMAFFVLTLSIFSQRIFAITSSKEDIICEGIVVNGIDLSGKTEEEAKSLIYDQVNGIKTKKAAIEVYRDATLAETVEVSFDSLGVGVSADKTVDEIISEIMKIGRKGNLIERYKELKDVREKQAEYGISFSFDETKLNSFIEEFVAKYEVVAEDASLKRENGAFVITGGKTGEKMNRESLRLSLSTSLKNNMEFYIAGNAKLTVKADIETTKPQYDKDDLAMVTDRLGSYTTAYADSSQGRRQNIQNGCRLINGSVLLPGESLSANKKMYPYTIANGYGVGGAYLNGKVVQDIGGGICQVSTTLYNAVLYSELEVVERQNHSMTVNYVPVARDAAIAGDYKDFVFKNNSQYPIYIEGITEGSKITFNIYGHETRDTVNRKVDFETVILKTIQPSEEVVEEDDTKPEDFEEITQKAWVGYKSALYKIVKVNGVETERSIVNSSNYRANPQYVVRGTKRADEEDKKEDKKKEKRVEGKKVEEKKVEEKKNKPSVEETVEEEEIEEIEEIEDEE